MKQEEILNFLAGKEGSLTRVFTPLVSNYFLKGAYVGAVKTVSREKPDSIKVIYRIRATDKLRVDLVLIDEALMADPEEYPRGEAPRVYIDPEFKMLTIEYNEAQISAEFSEKRNDYNELKTLVEKLGI